MANVKLKHVTLLKPTIKGVESVARWEPNIVVPESKINSLLDSIERNHVMVDGAGYKCNALYGQFKES